MGLAAHQEEIIAQLYREMYRKLVVYAENALNDSLAEEAVQDTFRIACSKYDELMNSSNPQGWLMNTLKNVIRNIRKEQANLNKYFVMTMSLDDEEFMEVCAVGTDVHKRLEDTEVDLMYSDLLTEEEYRLLTLIVRYRYSILEAALEFGINVETCKKRIQRAKKKLRKILEKSIDDVPKQDSSYIQKRRQKMLASNARSNRDFSYFDKLSTEELREIIRQDSLLDENEDSDIDAILYITEVLANREKEENERNVKDVEAAWKSFKENYYPYISDFLPSRYTVLILRKIKS
ncbi:MAG: sigma-70 family RNA polymerase sigma factor [Oscillospiraceae bacterium]